MGTKPTEEPASDVERMDRLFQALADGRRRFVVRALTAHHTMTVADLADECAEWEHDAPLQEIDADDVLDIYLSFVHNHVKKLADADLVEYDEDQELVALADNERVAQAQRHLAVCDETADE